MDMGRSPGTAGTERGAGPKMHAERARSRRGRVARIGSAVARALAPDEIHRVLDQVVQHREPVAHAAGAAGQVDDERPAADAGDAARERRAGEPRVDRHPERLGDAGRLLARARRGWPRG